MDQNQYNAFLNYMQYSQSLLVKILKMFHVILCFYHHKIIHLLPLKIFKNSPFVSIFLPPYYRPMMDTNYVEPTNENLESPNESMSTQFSPFSSQIGIENITLDEEGGSNKKKQVKWSLRKDILLIGAWLDVSNDPIVDVEVFG